MLQDIREGFQASPEDSRHLGDKDPVIGDGDALIAAAGGTVFHFPFIEHTSSAVHHQAVSADVVRKLCAGSKDKFRIFARILSYPAGDLMRSDIITLAVMGTAFRNEDFVAVLYPVQSRGPLYGGSQISLVAGEQDRKRSQGYMCGSILGYPGENLAVGDDKAGSDAA